MGNIKGKKKQYNPFRFFFFSGEEYNYVGEKKKKKDQMGGRLINCPAFVTSRPRHDIRGLLAKLKGVPGSPVLKYTSFLILFSYSLIVLF
jgi:hypothetical protein